MGLDSLRPDNAKVSRHSLKFEKRKHFYENVRKASISLSATKTISKAQNKKTRARKKKLKAYDLSSLTATLPDEAEIASSPSRERLLHAKSNLSYKSRRKLQDREGKQLQAVLSHPAFQSNPAEVIRRHLEIIQPPRLAKNDKAKREKSKKRKGEKSSSGLKPMEV
ncbi:ribosome biogenesis protein [Wolffia australiana]